MVVAFRQNLADEQNIAGTVCDISDRGSEARPGEDSIHVIRLQPAAVTGSPRRGKGVAEDIAGSICRGDHCVPEAPGIVRLHAIAGHRPAADWIRRTVEVRQSGLAQQPAADRLVVAIHAIEVDGTVQRRLFDIRQNPRLPTEPIPDPIVSADSKPAESVVVVVKRKTVLFQIVLALSAARGFSGLLDGWQQQRDENRDDRNDHQQLNEREAALGPLLKTNLDHNQLREK